MDHSTIISSAEEQLRHYGVFLDEHDKKLEKILARNNSFHREKAVLKKPLVQVNYAANEEEMMLVKILESERVINKILLTFGHLCSEIDDICKEAKQLQLKFLYKNEELLVIRQYALSSNNVDFSETSKGGNDKQLMLKISESMEFLYRMLFFLQRIILLGNNLLHQCGAVLATDKSESGLEMKLMNICDYLSNLFLQFLIFDEILHHSNFARFWPAYKKTIGAIPHSDSSWDNCNASELSGLHNCLQELDFLFSGCIFRHFLDSTFNIKEKIGPHGVGQLTQQFNDYMKLQLQEIDKINQSELSAFNNVYSLIKLNGFCVVFHDFCGQVDSKSVKILLELNAKYQAIMMIGNMPWSSVEFLRKNAHTLVKPHEKLLMDVRRQQQLFLQHHGQKLSKDCRLYYNEISLWMLKIERILCCGAFEWRIEQFKELGNLLLQGIQTPRHLRYLIKGIVSAHENLQLPISKTTLLTICKMLEMLKMLQIFFNEHATNIAKVMHCILQYNQYKLLQLINACKKKIISSKLRDKSVDALAALKIVERCLHGPPTKARILVAKLAFDAASGNYKILSADQKERFRSLIKRIELITDLQDAILELCDTSFLFWHQSILNVYLKQIVDNKIDFNSFQYLIQAATECGKMLNFLNLEDLHVSKEFRKCTYENIRSEIISKLCAQIEIFLRLEVHANLQVEKVNPFDQGTDDYRELINTCPLEVNGNYLTLKDHIENYLSAMFYNLTTISLHDWKTYKEMRHLANQRLLLNPVEDHLPNQTLEQGIDILEIMRKIHIFVSKYVYNMNSQIFVEQSSSNKHLDTIGIRHVANSLRTHGTGVINTTVNFTYQFLRQKFYTFSQFLYDEQIKARLMKELRSFGERKQQDNYPLYTFERADAFNKDIRKLGLANGGQTYMDLFRKVITHVGNAIGYIRLVRSGSIHANYSASLYLPKFDENLELLSQCKEERLSDFVQIAAENVEANIQNLTKNFTGNTDYFKLLVEAFQPFFRNPHNLHLRNFFLIAPPLIMNYVEYMLAAKSKINRKDREETVLFDDGFAVGLAYVLKLLNQINDFNSLQWFSTVRERFDAERRKIKEMLLEINSNTASATAKANTNVAATQKSENEKLQQTLILTERRINSHQMEYNLLYYSLCSAKIFFQ